jgi:ethanolaminephosphotransferase
VIKFIPTSLAPNLITLMGFSLVLTSTLLCIIHTPTLTELPTPLLCGIHGLLFYVYNVFDNCDGKQARRTKSSSPLGELFDHSCDALTVGLTNIVLCSTIGFYATDWRIIGLQLFGALPFFFCAWEKYYTHTMNLWYINGPGEGMFIITVLMTLGYFTGPEWWLQDWKAVLGLQIDWLPSMSWGTAAILPFTPLGLIPTLIVHMLTVKKECEKKGKSFNQALGLLVPFLTLITCHIFWFYFSPTNIMKTHPRFFLLSMGFVFCFLVGRMMTAALLKEPYWGLRGGTINYKPRVAIMMAPLFVGVINVAVALARGGKEIDLLFPEWIPLVIYFFISFAQYAHFAVNVILEITRGLGFYCFDLGRKFVASIEEDPNGDNDTTLEMMESKED